MHFKMSSAICLNLDQSKILSSGNRLMSYLSYSGRRLEELNPGEYKSTKNSVKPVVVEGHWEEPTVQEQEKHDTVHKLQVPI